MAGSARRYRKIHVCMWDDAKFCALSGPGPNGKSLWQYLLSGRRTTAIPGVVIAREAVLADDLRWPLEGFRGAFGEIADLEMVAADWGAGLVWLPNALAYDAPQSPNVVIGWRVAWAEIPECTLKSEIWRALKAFTEGLGEAFAEGFAKGCPQPSPTPEAEQEQEQEQEQEESRARARERHGPTGTAKKGAAKKPLPEEALELARRLAEHAAAVNPLHTPPNLERWARDLDRLHRIGKQPWEQIARVIDWVTRPGCWWSDKIASAAGLRKHWDTITGQMSRPAKAYSRDDMSSADIAAWARELEERGE